MYLRALTGKEKAYHTSTLDTVNNLGILYANQGKMNEAEEMWASPGVLITHQRLPQSTI